MSIHTIQIKHSSVSAPGAHRSWSYSVHSLRLNFLFNKRTIRHSFYFDTLFAELNELHQTPREVYGSGARYPVGTIGKYLTGDHANITSDMIL